jgi:translocation and assembly module TamB
MGVEARRRIFKIVAATTLVVLSLLAVAYLSAQTDQGRDFVARQIEKFAASEPDLSVSVGEISGNLFSDFSISSLSVSDNKGAWLAAENLKVGWKPLALLVGRLEIKDISLQTLEISRRPESGEPQAEDPGSSSIPVSIELDQVTLEKIILEEPVLGREALLTASFKLNTLINDAIYSEVNISRLDGNAGSVKGLFQFHPEFRTLAVDIKILEPQGGLVSRALELPGFPEITVSLVGDGVLNAWRGQLRLNATDVFESELAISTRGETQIEIDLQGGGILAENMTTALPLIDGSYIGVEAALAWNSASEVFSINSSRIENANLTIAVDGSVDFAAETLKAELISTLRNPDALNALMAPVSTETAAVDLRLDGTFSEILVNAILQAGELDVEDSLAAREATGTFSSKIDMLELKEIPLNGSAAIAGISKLPAEYADALGDVLDVDFEAVLDWPTQILSLTSLKVASKSIGATGTARYALDTGDIDARTQIDVAELTGFIPASGALTTVIDVKGSVPEGQLSANVNMQSDNLAFQDTAVTSLVGGRANASANIVLQDETVNISALDVKLPIGSVAGEAAIPLSFDTISAQLTADVPELARLGAFVGTEMTGQGRLKAVFDGRIDDPGAKGTLTMDSLKLEGYRLTAAKMNFLLDTLASSPTGKVDGKIASEDLEIQFSSNVTVPGFEKLQLDAISVSEKNNSLSGALDIPFDGSPIIGEFDATLPDMQSIAAFTNEKLSGNLKISGQLKNQNGQQGLATKVNAKSFNLPDYRISARSLDLQGSLVGDFSDPAITASLDVADFSFEETVLENFTATAKGNLSSSTFDFSMKRLMEPVLQLSGAGEISKKQETLELSLNNLDGDIEGERISLQKAFRVRQQGYNIELDEFALTLADGTLSGAAVVDKTSARANFKIVSMPVELARIFDPEFSITGDLDGTATINMQEQGSTGKFSFAATKIQVDSREFPDAPVFASHLSGTIGNGKIEFNSDITGLQKTALNLSGAIPITATFEPFKTQIDHDKPVKIILEADSNIKALWPILKLDTQKASGTFVAKASIQGTLNDPLVTGKATLSKGSYEHTEYGAVLSSITLDVDVQDTETLTLNLDALDGKGGRIDADGTIILSSISNPDIDLAIKANDLRAFNLEEIEVTTDADIAVKGNLAALNVTGDITTRRVEIDIGGDIAPTVVNLKVKEINRPGAVKQEVVNRTDFDQKVLLDMKLDLPGRVFMRGRGLDSEWKGKFTIKGTAEKPVIQGSISPVRGQFVFAGKSFALQDGEISLLGGSSLDPELSLAGKYESADIVATVSIIGPASDPKISFSSDDGLPEDEVLSQVLFGKSSGGLSAFEAVQLAEALASISGNLGSGGGITGFVRNTLGVDVVSADTNSETGAAEVSVGKYVNENVYVGVEQGADSGSTRAKVQIDITPNLSVETEVGQSTDSRVGVFWKFDY